MLFCSSLNPTSHGVCNHLTSIVLHEMPGVRDSEYGEISIYPVSSIVQSVRAESLIFEPVKY